MRAVGRRDVHAVAGGGARWDGGDGETGTGMELGGGLEWTLPSRGPSVEARGRTLEAHGGDMEEWGA